MTTVKIEGYTRVASTDEVPPGVTRKVALEGKDLLLANIDGKYYAIGNTCTHVGGPLDEGMVHGFEVECPWHGSRFDLRNGMVMHGPARAPEPSYDVRIEGKDLLVRPK
jgi:glycine betaine catabolism B